MASEEVIDLIPAGATTVPVEEESVDLASLLKEFQEWIASRETDRQIQIKHVPDEDVWELSLGADYPIVLAYLSEIDADFYGEEAGVFLEVQLGTPSASFDYPRALEFCSQEMVLGRLTLRRDEGEDPLLLVEAGCPFGEVELELLELMVLELAAIGLDIKEEMKGQFAQG